MFAKKASEEFFEDYKSFMDTIIERGYAMRGDTDVDVFSQCSSPLLTKSSLYRVFFAHRPQVCVYTP